MKRSLIACLLLLISPLFVYAQQNNLSWIKSNISGILDSANFIEIKPVNIKFSENVSGEKKGFLKNELIKYFSQKDDSIAVKNSIFWIEQFDTRIVYQQESGGLLGLGTITLRQNTIILAGWIENEITGELIKSFDIVAKKSEGLESGVSTDLEKSAYSFTKGETKELSIWTETIEPVIVVSAIATIVYLFFSIRT